MRLIFICLTVSWLALHADRGIQEKLKQVPSSDKEVLSHFFKGLLTQGNFALTLFGYRPASLFTHQLSCTLTVMPPLLRSRFLMEYEGWKVWEKYQGLFEMQNFLFQKIPSPEESGSFTILFVHRKKMARVLEQFGDLFPGKSMDAILFRVFTQGEFQDPQFHLLQGVLLGYGLENAKAFQEMTGIDDTLEFFPYDIGEKSLNSIEPKPRNLLDGYPRDLFMKREVYRKKFSFQRIWAADNPFFCTKPYGYCAFDVSLDPQLESLQQKIIDLYNSDAFLEELLTMLTK